MARQNIMMYHCLDNTCHVERVLSLNFGCGGDVISIDMSGTLSLFNISALPPVIFHSANSSVQSWIKSVINIL